MDGGLIHDVADVFHLRTSGLSYEEISRIMALPEVRERLLQLGLDPMSGSPDQLGALVRSEIPKWARIIKDAGIKPE